MEHLIANSGIHFITREIEFNPSEPMKLGRGGILKYSFCEATDIIESVKTFSVLCGMSDGQKVQYFPVDELLQSDGGVPRYPMAVLRHSSGREVVDEAGLVVMSPDCDVSPFAKYVEGDPEMYTVNSLQSFRDKAGSTAFDLLLDKWLPMPMFIKADDGVTNAYPLAWCRMKMMRVGDGVKPGMQRFRLVWAFDTQMADDDFAVLRPCFEGESANFCLCNRVDLLMDFMSSSDDFHAFSDYIASLLGVDTLKDDSRRYKAYYIYFINFIRLSGAAPEVTLHNKETLVPVDLVLDIGNSRTCGILFEKGDFTKGKMLELRDLTSPWICYENKTFDMRVVFRKADFGNDIVLDEEMFQWKSFVRVGEEARKLVYRSLEDGGLSEKTTNYSSPKRYLWDTKQYHGQWENLTTKSDSFGVAHSNEISIPGLSELFDADGAYKPDNRNSAVMDLEGSEHRYSRSSLMTFAYVEIFQHAISQINSVKYREKWGDVDCRRFIRRVIITCPTAMPLSERVYLRQSAHDAFHALTSCMPGLQMPEIIPSASAVKVIDPFADPKSKVWSYDEASCCQLVYLYAELKRYSGKVGRFFELKGHVRPELAAEGYHNKALTIGTIDIGAGTTDIMVCSYIYDGEGHAKVTPDPLFWDSFYLAGDDILRNLVQNIVIEGKEHGQPDMGNISAALTARIMAMPDDELLSLPCLDSIVYAAKVNDIVATIDSEEKKAKKVAFASNLIHDFFGADSSMMGYRDRRCRNDFNTQISVPIAQRLLELLRTRRPSKLYTYDELFPDIKPADYLLDYFEHHFGFRFEELSWRYDPSEVADIVRVTMEPLMKQLAVVLYAQHCDVIVLAGRPTSLDPITELFVKYVPTSPDRLIRLNDYRVGNWCPTADGQGYFYDQKAIVAVGGMVGYLASHGGLNDLVIDFSKMVAKMTSTANYLGEYNSRSQQVEKALLTPISMNATLSLSVFPAYIGCRQLDSVIYQARPLYAIYNHGDATTLQVMFSRLFNEDKEKIFIEQALDSEYRDRQSELELVPQSLVDDGKYWLDKGEFELTIK